jgi:hypothetical protein
MIVSIAAVWQALVVAAGLAKLALQSLDASHALQ